MRRVNVRRRGRSAGLPRRVRALIEAVGTGVDGAAIRGVRSSPIDDERLSCSIHEPRKRRYGPVLPSLPECTQRMVIRCSLLAVIGVAACATVRNGVVGPALAITHVTLIDGRDSLPRRDHTVIVRGNRIAAVGPARQLDVPEGATVIDGRGKFLIPGLWDMHVHTDVPAGREVLALYVRNGVTGVRDMAGRLDVLRGWNDSIRAGHLTGPRIVASGPYLEGGATPIPHLLARDSTEAYAAVDSLVRLGVPFVKVHTRIRPETFFAIARRARLRRIPFSGHVPASVGALAASDSGMRSVEHLLGVPLPCTAAESLALRPRFPVQAALGRCSSIDLTHLYGTMARNGTWVTPTLTAMYEIASWPRREVPGDSVADFIPDTLRRFVASIFQIPEGIPADADSVGMAVMGKRLVQLAAMHRSGVGILAGTDAPLRNSPPGFGLHEELRLLAQSGLSPFSVLRLATLEPARYFGFADSLGTIERGHIADLILLDGDPLTDIRNTRRIATVIANGRQIAPARRQRQ